MKFSFTLPDIKLHTITVLPLNTVYFVSEVHCTLSVLHSIMGIHILLITVQSSTIILLRSTVDYHLIKV